MLKTFTLALLMAITGMATAQANFNSNTLGNNDAIPNSLLVDNLDSATANALLAAEYRGFYEINSKVRGNKMIFTRINSDRSFPDDRWTSLATGIAGLTEFPAYSTGSRIDPKATAYVAFYDREIEGLDTTDVVNLPTSAEGEPNTLALLVVHYKNRMGTNDNASADRMPTNRTGTHVFLFELTL